MSSKIKLIKSDLYACVCMNTKERERISTRTITPIIQNGILLNSV